MCVIDEMFDFEPKKSEFTVDLSYLEDLGTRDKYEIPTCFDSSNFEKGQCFDARIIQVYDISKFWIVTKHRELEAFQKYLFRYYYINQTHYRIPVDELHVGVYCVAFTDNAYYRGVIVGIPITYRDEDERQVQIHFIDYGMVAIIQADNVFYMSESCLKVPQFAIRASLAWITPLKNRTWTSHDVASFNSLSLDKILVGVVVYVFTKKRVVGVHLGIQNNKSVDLIHEALIAQKCARFYINKEETETEHGFKYPFLLPSHEALESGMIPTKISDAEYQEQITSSSSLSISINSDQKPLENGPV